MIPNYVLVWAKQYFYTTIGLNAPEHLTPEMEQEAVRYYSDKFAKPVSYMLQGVVSNNITKEDINSFLVTMRMCKVPTILHYLKPMVDYGWFIFTGNLEDDLKSAIATMKERCKENYYIVKGGSPFKGFYLENESCVFDVPFKVIRLGEARRFRQGLTLQGLREADPIRSNDFVISAIKTCVEEGIMDASEITSVFYCVPSKDGFNTIPVTALTPELPSFATRKLISCLPDSYVQEYASPYHAALQYATEHDEYNRCLNELKDIVGWIDESTPTDGLNDEVVMEYLHKKYGISNETLQSLFVPISSKIYSSTYLLDSESKNMTAEEFIERVAKEENVAQGSFDELILAYCTSENVDLKCTVEQLISNIVYELPVTPKSFSELAKEYKEENSISGETTLEELIKGEKHVYVDNTDIAMDVVNNCSGFSDECKRLIHDVIFDIDEKTRMELPDVATELSKIGLPDDLLTAIIVAEQTGNPIVMPEAPKQEISEDDVITYLVRAGIARVDAKSLAMGAMPKPSETDINKEVHKKLKIHYSEEDVTSILQGNGLLPSEDRVREMIKELGMNEDSISAPISCETLNEPGYKVANSLLTDIRRSISSNDSDELRTNLLPILYSYMRVLMMSSGDKDDVIDFLTKKKTECKSEIAEFIDNAISMLRE